MSTTTSKTVLSTADALPRPRISQSISIHDSSDDERQPGPAPQRRSAKSRLGVKNSNSIHHDFTGSWWHHPEIIPEQLVREAVAREINSHKQKATKLAYGVAQKDNELAALRLQQTDQLQHLKSESERVLAKQNNNIGELHIFNDRLEIK